MARPKLSDVLYSDILGQIRGGGFGPDSRLPSEKDLSQQFGVSRPIVREALRRLRVDGIIHSRQGAGSFVSSENSPLASAPARSAPKAVQSISDVRRVYEFRRALEGEIAYAAAVHRTPELVAAIEEELARISQALKNGSSGVEEDGDFHAAIAAATQNQFFEDALSALRPHLNFVIALSRTFSALRSAEHRAIVHREHLAICELIKLGDAAGAREAMQLHVRNAQDRVFEGIRL